ncbi:MAG: 50S ribosomal protein L3 N(5)-glutamine methyltransferase [Orrella sp.]
MSASKHFTDLSVSRAVEHASGQLDELLTIRDWLRFAVSQLHRHEARFGQGTDNAWDDAVFLVLGCLDLPVDQLEPYLDARLLTSERKVVAQALYQRCEMHTPTSYILSEAWQQGFRFHVSTDVLIPRSPIAELLATGLYPWIEAPESLGRIADLCTGSGCLAILAAIHFPNAIVDATDLSDAALGIASKNVASYELANRVNLHQGDMLEALPKDQKYDLIICNPPYVNQTSMAQLPPEFLHEPTMALAGGEDGMTLIKRLIAGAAKTLKPEGHLLLEIGHERPHFDLAFPHLTPLWIDTLATEQSLMLLRADQLSS